MPCAASTSSTAPSHAASDRDTSYVKSTCPGVSIMLSAYGRRRPTPHGMRTACDLMVMPRSRSMSMRSRYCARIARGVDDAGELQHAVGQRRLAVVDVRDDAEVAQQLGRASPRAGCATRAAALGIGDKRTAPGVGVGRRAVVAPSRRTVTGGQPVGCRWSVPPWSHDDGPRRRPATCSTTARRAPGRSSSRRSRWSTRPPACPGAAAGACRTSSSTWPASTTGRPGRRAGGRRPRWAAARSCSRSSTPPAPPSCATR